MAAMMYQNYIKEVPLQSLANKLDTLLSRANGYTRPTNYWSKVPLHTVQTQTFSICPALYSGPQGSISTGCVLHMALVTSLLKVCHNS